MKKMKKMIAMLIVQCKIQLVMQNSCISTRNFEEARTIYSASKPVEIFMGSNTENVIDTLFSTILQRFQQAQETSNDKGSEFIPESKKQVILLMITDGKKWHYLAVTNLSALLEEKSSNHHGDFYCLNCFSSYTSKINLKSMKKYVMITIAAM